MIPQTVQIREFTEKDIDFVSSTWLRYYRYHSPFGRKVRNGVFFPNHRKVIQNIIDRPSSSILVSCLEDDPQVILGYIAIEVITQDEEPLKIIHFAYVKEDFRGYGIAKDLFMAADFDLNKCSFTHFCDNAFKYMNKFPKLTHNPYLL